MSYPNKPAVFDAPGAFADRVLAALDKATPSETVDVLRMHQQIVATNGGFGDLAPADAELLYEIEER